MGLGWPALRFGVEYEHRKAGREARTRDRFGKGLGGVILALTDEPASTRGDARFAQSERRRPTVADISTRYYVLLGDPGKSSDSYFRVASGGVYHRWDAKTHAWVHVTTEAARDFYSRAIENGDGVVPATPAEVAGLH